ncbi:ATPase, activator of (R)-hydroxyglutaryl-CoA dehydratase [Desulforamulus hydrothermalis Lam5 = DSM 18033]|uniref:ATPase, activator of (R)-hydroxyglutaryl-CoA dehydratase n=1 Tax=Desulforamulus hydrothermalis Lam5 = DSM 18033 TaxID=1121428 RepID=K8DYI9_9FIRM|nr:ATPase, activator of (R)-hydroxyglutaryl-CoA dehydratase [Desulforamulus hydrothermalis Lam5 = DSM 18033]
MIILICGIDLGSRHVKVALLAADGSLQLHRYDTVSFYRQHGRSVAGQLQVDLAALGLGRPERLVATGYGRQTINLQGAAVIPEIKAHVLGAMYQTGLEDFTLLDLGGQDSKVVLVSRGKMIDFQTNDKCAASTGRYLENMAAVLDMTMEELARYDEHPVDLNSTCAIFGETELIGKVVEGHPVSSLAAGVNYTIFKRMKPMLTKLLSDTIVFTGGVAHNQALVKIIATEMKVPVVVPDHPQYNGAIGCCQYALNT